MSSSSQLKILVTGATGFIGGTVLAKLLTSEHPVIRSSPVSVLIRDEDGSRSALLKKTYGDRVKPIRFGDLDDTEHVVAIAAEHDVAINTTTGFHETFGKNLVDGLAKRKNDSANGLAPLLIHQTGSSNVADRPITETPQPDRVFDDARGTATYEWETKENKRAPYPQRTTELAVTNEGEKTGVKTCVMMSPTIYGVGDGLFHRHSQQIPNLTRQALQHGQALVIGDGSGVWDHVHVEDLADLYVMILAAYLDGSPSLPTGKRGVIFTGSGKHSWKGLAMDIAEVAYSRDQIKTKDLKHISMQEVEGIFGDERVAELNFASNSNTIASVAKQLGWKPKHGEESWKKGFEETLSFVLKDQGN